MGYETPTRNGLKPGGFTVMKWQEGRKAAVNLKIGKRLKIVSRAKSFLSGKWLPTTRPSLCKSETPPLEFDGGNSPRGCTEI